MRVTIRQKNIEITPPLQTYLESKLLKPIRRLLKGPIALEFPTLDIELGRTTRHHHKGKIYRVQAQLSLGKRLLRAEAEDEDVRAACDILEEELKHQILTLKGRRIAQEKRGARRAKKDFRFDPAVRLYRKGRIRSEGN